MNFWADLFQTLTFRGGYNTNVVLSGTTVLGVACGIIGSFLLLRRRSLVADALSHAALPGVCLGFLVSIALGHEERSLWMLLTGATVMGLIGVGTVHLLTTLPRVKEEAAIGVVLSVFFAGGVVLLSVIQGMDVGSRAGLSKFIFGSAATMQQSDSQLITVIALGVLAVCAIAYKELRLVCFDAAFARGLGFSTLLLDGLLLAMLTVITVAGLHAVGAILMVALVIIPPATARCWTNRLQRMVLISAIVGGLGCFLGTAASAVLNHLPTGPAIVVACGIQFVLSLIIAPQRGIISSAVRRWQSGRSIAREHLLRAMFELGELGGDVRGRITIVALRSRRRWATPRLRRLIAGAIRRHEIWGDDDTGYALTNEGIHAAEFLVRRHRLWEHFLSTQAGVAPTHVDRGADDMEHVLGPELVASLEAALRAEGRMPTVPASIHPLDLSETTP